MSIPLTAIVLYCHCEYMVVNKEDRLQIRVDPDAKRLLEEAAASVHLSVSAFVLQSAAERAEDVLLERRVIRLSDTAVDAFAEALNRPAQVNERLAAALGTPSKLTWID